MYVHIMQYLENYRTHCHEIFTVTYPSDKVHSMKNQPDRVRYGCLRKLLFPHKKFNTLSKTHSCPSICPSSDLSAVCQVPGVVQQKQVTSPVSVIVNPRGFVSSFQGDGARAGGGQRGRLGLTLAPTATRVISTGRGLQLCYLSRQVRETEY